ncbi:MAG: hypothetical protein WBL19_00760 [Minisyncoccia bacterium]
MDDIYRKYIKDRSYEELIDTQRSSIPGGEVYEQVTQAIHRIQQDTNNTQIAKLINEVGKLKEITEEDFKTTKKENKLAKTISIFAILLSMLGILTQVALDIERKDNCYDYPEGRQCVTWFDFGIFGTYKIPLRPI